MKRIDKADAVALAGSQRKLAKLLGVTPQAVNRWNEGPIPDLQCYRLRELKPQWFRKTKAEA